MKSKRRNSELVNPRSVQSSPRKSRPAKTLKRRSWSKSTNRSTLLASISTVIVVSAKNKNNEQLINLLRKSPISKKPSKKKRNSGKIDITHSTITHTFWLTQFSKYAFIYSMNYSNREEENEYLIKRLGDEIVRFHEVIESERKQREESQSNMF